MTEHLSIEQGRKILQDSASEAQIQAAIIGYLHTQKIVHTVTEAKHSYNENGQLVRRIAKGWPDITAVEHGGRAFFIECKSAKGKLRPDQARTLYALAGAGALIVIARSVDDVIEVRRTWKVRDKDLLEILDRKDRIEKPRPMRKTGRRWARG